MVSKILCVNESVHLLVQSVHVYHDVQMRIDSVQIHISAKSEEYSLYSSLQSFTSVSKIQQNLNTHDIVSIKFFSICGSSFLTRTSRPVTFCSILNEIHNTNHSKTYLRK